jgi:membrane peptidoglycan carboxypeptidase
VGQHAAGAIRRRPLRLLAAMLAVSCLAGVIGSALLIPVAAATSQAVNLGDAVFDTLPATPPNGAVPTTSELLAADGSPIAYFYDQNRTDVPLDRIAPTMQKAIVAIEDARFYSHGAADPKGIVRALISDRTGGDSQGASTLTQQYVKNLLVAEAVTAGDSAAAQAAVEHSVARKIRELRLAITVEQQLTKQQILERYLNIVFFGQQSYGVQAAAERYFGVGADRLDLPQSALLAGLVQDPSGYDPIIHPNAAKARRNVVLAAMRDQKVITPAQYTSAAAAPVITPGKAMPNGCATAGTTGFFCEYVVQSILTSPVYSVLGATQAERRRALQTGGLVIRSTLDPAAQAAAVEAVMDKVPPADGSGLGAAAVTVEPGTGAVTAMAQNRSYSVTAGSGRTSVNYATDSSLGGSSGFQTGSSFKPFTLAAWLAKGHSLDETVDATKRDFPFSDFTACGQQQRGSQPYAPGNSEGDETGPMSVLDATSNSVNVAYVQMETQLDLCDIAQTAQSLGVHLAAAEKPECSGSTAPTTQLPTCLPSLTLGVKNIAPLTMAAAYAGFASGGTYCAPLPIRSITQTSSTAGGSATTIPVNPDCHQALSPEVAAGVTAALSRVLTDGTAAAVGPLDPWPSAGKTGTTDGPYDTWFVGYTAQRSTAVWVADPGSTRDGGYHRERLTGIDVGGSYYSTVFGASIAAPIWKAVMTAGMHGLPAQSLPGQ